MIEIFAKNLFRGIKQMMQEIRKAETIVLFEPYGNLPYLLMARLLGKRSICDFQNCETELGRSLAADGGLKSRSIGLARMVYGWTTEELFLRLCDVITLPSKNDQCFFRRYHRHFRTKMTVIPNVLPEPPVPAVKDPPIDGTLNVVFVGGADYAPNRNACIFIRDELAPLLQHLEHIKLILIGAGTEELRPRTTNVKTLGYVKYLEGLLASAQVGISPVFSGSGTSYKMLTYLCAGLVVVGSTRSTRGLDPRLTKAVFLADTAREFARILEDIYSRPESYMKTAAETGSLARELCCVNIHFITAWRTLLGAPS